LLDSSASDEQQRVARQLLRSLLDEEPLAASANSNGHQHVEDLIQAVHGLSRQLKQLQPSLPQQMRFLEKSCLEQLLPLPQTHTRHVQLSFEYEVRAVIAVLDAAA
jgi:hypothetical protein